jgi:hypothetical protein
MASQTWWAAGMRACLTVLVTLVWAVFQNYQQWQGTVGLTDGEVWKKAAIAGTLTALAPIVTRLGIEGGWDAYRQSKNEQTPADVGYDKPAKP